MNLGSVNRCLVLPMTLCILLSVPAVASAAGTSPVVGTVQKVSGTAYIVRHGQTIPATLGLEVWENDTFRTGPDGSMGVVFRDDTLCSLGPESLLFLDTYVFAPREGKFSIVLRMIKGTAAYLSGLISKLAPESAHMETPTASIGIRGTRFAVKVEGN